ncbi:MAG TPA: Hpt domain-containing protein, partial [Dokdonella sp.]
PVLFDILQSEVAAHLGVMDEYLARCEPVVVPASEPLLRAAHTLNGAIAMVEIPAIGNVLAPLENYIKRLRGVGIPPSPEGVAALRDTIALTREAMARLEAGNSNLPDSTALVSRMIALRDALPEVHTADVWASDAVEPIVADETAADDVAGEDSFTAVDLSGAGIVADAPAASGGDGGILDEALWQEIIELTSEPVAPADPFEPDPAALAAFDPQPLPEISGDGDIPAVAHDAAFDAMFDEFAAAQAADEGLDEGAEPAPTMTYDEALSAFVEETADDAAGDAAGVPSFDLSDLSDLEVADALPALDPAPEPEPVVEPLPDVPDLDAIGPVDVEAADEPAPLADVPGALPPRTRATLDGPRSPPLADDPQPDGPLDVADADDDLLDIFVQESADILDHADTLVASLREAPDDRAPIVGLQRDLHTLKGGARMAGLAPIGDLTHAMESLVDAVGEGRVQVDRAAVESLERGFDRLHVLVQRVAQRRAIAMPTHAITRYESLVGGVDLAAA